MSLSYGETFQKNVLKNISIVTGSNLIHGHEGAIVKFKSKITLKIRLEQ